MWFQILRPTAIASLLWLGWIAAAGPVAAEPHSFGGVKLGATLTDVRRVRYAENASARMLCSHDAEARDIRPVPDFLATPVETQSGARVCAAFTFAKALGPASTALPAEWILARVRVANIDVSPIYWFVPDKGTSNDASTRLYRIVMRSNTAFWDDTRAAFIRRYGKPDTVEKGGFPNGRGGLIESETVTWSTAESTIRMVKRGEFANRMTITFEHKTLPPWVTPPVLQPAAGPPAGTPTPAPANPG